MTPTIDLVRSYLDVYKPAKVVRILKDKDVTVDQVDLTVYDKNYGIAE